MFFEEINELHNEDLRFFDTSVYYVAILHNRIIGSIKVTQWDNKSPLPIQKLFAIDRNHFALNSANKSIWHVGRLAISKTENPYGISLFKQLLTMAITAICIHPGSVMVAECDQKLLRILTLLGIQTKVLAPAIDYLGSATFPIYALNEWLKIFLKKNESIGIINSIYPIKEAI